MKISVAREALPDQRRADDDAILLDQAAVGLVGHGDLSDPGHRQRIDKAGQDVNRTSRTSAGRRCWSMGLCLRSSQMKGGDDDVDRLDADEGQIRPPRP